MKIVTFGEIMLRLAPEGYLRFVQADKFCATYGGGEANVAVSMANFGVEASFVSKLPQNELGTAALQSLSRYGVDTKHIVRGGDRLGIYFIEKGASVRSSKVIYDRARSAISEAKRQDFDWNSILDDASWFHFTGITPALSKELPEITLDALKLCKQKGITVSCDLNYRSKLWSKSEAQHVMTSLMPYVDVLICNEEDAADVFGIYASETDVLGGVISTDGYTKVATELYKRFCFKYVAITMRGSISASDNNWKALLYNGKESLLSREYNLRIVDRVGGGDSFAAGLIYALSMNKDESEAINFAVAASALKHTIEGDFNMISVAEAEALAKGDGSGRVKR